VNSPISELEIEAQRKRTKIETLSDPDTMFVLKMMKKYGEDYKVSSTAVFL
jgi:hypothetical protein